MSITDETAFPPASVSTIAGWQLWRDTMRDLADRNLLTPETIESAKRYVLAAELADMAEKMILKEGSVTPSGELNPWCVILQKADSSILECSELLGLTPADRGLIKELPVEQQRTMSW